MTGLLKLFQKLLREGLRERYIERDRKTAAPVLITDGAVLVSVAAPRAVPKP